MRRVFLLSLTAVLLLGQGQQQLMISQKIAAGGGGGPIALIASNKATANGVNATATVSALNCTGANFYAIGVSSNEADTAVVSDSQSNSYTGTTNTAVYTASSGKFRIYFVAGVTGGSSVNFSVTADYPSIYVECFSNVATSSPKDAENKLDDYGGTSAAAGSIAPAVSNELMITGLVRLGQSGTLTVDSSYTITDQAVFSPGNFYGGGMAYKIKTNSTAENPIWSGMASQGAGLLHAAFKP